jgi:hypothetical protein
MIYFRPFIRKKVKLKTIIRKLSIKGVAQFRKNTTGQLHSFFINALSHFQIICQLYIFAYRLFLFLLFSCFSFCHINGLAIYRLDLLNAILSVLLIF